MKAPARFARRSRWPRPCWAVVAVTRATVRATGSPSAAAMRRASSSAWSKPRSRRRRGWTGTHVTRSPAAACGLPACGKGIREWSHEAPFPAVLQRVERGSDRPAEARAPFELDDPDRLLGGQAERPSRGLSMAPPERCRAALAQDLTLAAAARTRRWQDQVEERSHRSSVTAPAYPWIGWCSSGDRVRPLRSGCASPRWSPRSPWLDAVALQRPGRQLEHGLGAACPPDHASPGGQVRPHRDDTASAITISGQRGTGHRSGSA